MQEICLEVLPYKLVKFKIYLQNIFYVLYETI